MQKYFKYLVAMVGSLVSYLFGGWSVILEVLLIFMIFDYLIGMIAAGIEGKLSSTVGLKGILRKIGIFLLVGAAHLVDLVLGNSNLFRDAAAFFYLANELLSMVENTGRIGLPIPPEIRNAVEILQKKGQEREKF